MVKLLCALLPVVAYGDAHTGNHCIGGSFSLTVDDAVSAEAWTASMKATVASLAGDGIDPAHVDVAVSYGGTAAPGDCDARYTAMAEAAAAAVPAPAASNSSSPSPPATPPSPTPPSPTPPSPTPPAPAPDAPAPAGGNSTAPAPPPAPANANVTAPAPAPANANVTAPAPAPASGASSGPSSGPSARLLSEMISDEYANFFDRRLAEATANVGYTVVAPPDVIAAASTALGDVDEDALTAAVSAAVEADATLTALPGFAAPTVVANSFTTPTEPAAQPVPAPSPTPSGEGDDSAAFSPSCSLLGVAVAAGSLIV